MAIPLNSPPRPIRVSVKPHWAVDIPRSSVAKTISNALIGAFIGEFVSAEYGLGHYILKSGGLYDIPRVIFGFAIWYIFKGKSL